MDFLSVRKTDMDVERVVLEAIKQKLEDTFKKINVSTSFEGQDIVIRITIPNIKVGPKVTDLTNFENTDFENLDDEALQAQKELMQ